MDFRPVAQVLGLLLVPFGAAMLPSAIMDALHAKQSWAIFGTCAFITMFAGACVALTFRGIDAVSLNLKQAYFLTTAVWALLPLIGAVPFIVGAPGVSLTDAYFEAMSGVTTTGSTVFVGLDSMPEGVLLWRGMLQWLGGLGIVIVAMIFLPVMKVGGMQFFRSEGFDTLGKVLPRALDISKALVGIYLFLTLICILSYTAFGMSFFEATVHALTTMSTGGFSTSDLSFAKFSGPLEYVSVIFMILASLPFIRFVQLLNGNLRAPLHDVQVRAYLRWIGYAVGVILVYRMLREEGDAADIVRETVFNTVTLFSGTGYGSANVADWGPLAFTVIIVVGLIGGCTASTGCSVKVFRWLVVWETIKQEGKRVTHPHRLVIPKLGKETLSDDVLSSVMAFLTLFILSFGLLTVGLSMTGLGTITSITAAWTAIANVGPAFGPEIGPTGAFDGIPEVAKWMMIFGMLIGRLELLSVFVLFLPVFWRE